MTNEPYNRFLYRQRLIRKLYLTVFTACTLQTQNLYAPPSVPQFIGCEPRIIELLGNNYNKSEKEAASEIEEFSLTKQNIRINKQGKYRYPGRKYFLRLGTDTEHAWVRTYGFPYKDKNTWYVDFSIESLGTVQTPYAQEHETPILHRMPLNDFYGRARSDFFSQVSDEGTTLLVPKGKRGQYELVHVVRPLPDKLLVKNRSGKTSIIKIEDAFRWNATHDRMFLQDIESWLELGAKGDIVRYETGNLKKLGNTPTLLDGYYFVVRELPKPAEFPFSAHLDGWNLKKWQQALDQGPLILAPNHPNLAGMADVPNGFLTRFFRNRHKGLRSKKAPIFLTPQTDGMTSHHEALHRDHFYSRSYIRMGADLKEVSPGLSLTERRALGHFLLEQRAHAEDVRSAQYLAKKGPKASFLTKDNFPTTVKDRAEFRSKNSAASMSRYAQPVNALLDRMRSQNGPLYEKLRQLIRRHSIASHELGIKKLLPAHFK